jgi:type III restriction enzyme
MELDEFESRRPIDMIKANRPILILDEPQKMEGKQTVSKLKEFNPLMILRYSATHKTVHNKIHRLDALDAYNQKLVKKISVKGVSTKGLSGTNAYLYLQSIEVAKGKDPVARVEMEVKQNSGPKRTLRKIEKGYNLYDYSNELEAYKGFVVSDIRADENTIHFTNGVVVSAGEAIGNVEEGLLRRIQIREAINSHLQKELELFSKGIKVLTLFFIDEVAKYRIYSEEGRQKGEYAKIFEEEYQNAVGRLGTILNPEYQSYLRQIEAENTHNGYFSIDKKGKLVDPKVKARGEGAGLSDDVDAYDLILKDKQRLLSFDEPTRFIFSHSALREGWDNPNIFVICTLKHSDNTIARRQEVGRGMRIAVNQKGERMDDPLIVHDINVLSVIANESYKDFVAGLQKEIASTLSDRPKVADEKYFKGKVIEIEDGNKVVIQEREAKLIERYLIKNDYVDLDGKISSEYHAAKEEGTIAPLPEELQPIAQQVFVLVDSVYSDVMLPSLENEYNQKPNPLNDNLKKKEFIALWENINQKAVYTVHFDSAELIDNAANALDKELKVRELQYQVIEGEMADDISDEKIKDGGAFKVKDSSIVTSDMSVHSAIAYDLIGKLAGETKLTRRTIGEILKKVSDKTFFKYRKNPEEFIRNAGRLINEQKATTVIEHLSYDKTQDKHHLEDIFTLESKTYDSKRLQEVNKHVYDFLITDSKGEKEFAEQLDVASEVVVYAKLPSSFFIPTPVGEYNPDWAIAFEEGKVKHIYFIAETKGSMSTMQLRKIEDIKIECARKFFDKVTSEKVKYDVVDSFDALMELVK